MALTCTRFHKPPDFSDITSFCPTIQTLFILCQMHKSRQQSQKVQSISMISGAVRVEEAM